MNNLAFKALVIILWFCIGIIIAFLIGHTKIDNYSFSMLKPWSSIFFIVFWTVCFIEEAIRLDFWN